MIVLGIETATQICGVGLAGPDGFMTEYQMLGNNIHAEYLPKAVELVIEGAGLTFRDLEGLAVSIGPGSFTGLRIGLSLVKGISFGHDLPVATVPTPDGLVFRISESDAEWLCVLLTARKVEAYQALYRRVGNQWALHGEVEVVPDREIGCDLPRGKIFFAGEGAFRFRDLIRERTKAPVFLPQDVIQPGGYAIAALGREKLLAGEAADIDSLVPLYLKRFQGVA